MLLPWIVYLLFIAGLAYLGWLGHKRTKSFGSFAIGSGDIPPVVVGLTLAASVMSAATFIINPGFIYVHGVAAFMHFVVAVGLGFCLMLVLLSFRFRRLGAETKALTMPHWIGNRFQSAGIALYFAFVNLFALAFVVLIVGGLSIVMQQMLGISNLAALLMILVFETTYIFLGGTYAHAFTNILLASLMMVLTVLVLASGLPLFFQSEPGFFTSLAAQDPNLVAWVNPASNLFNGVFSIYISGFLIGAAVVCQPHILTKSLYVKNDQAVRQYLTVAVTALIVFFLLPFAGFYARLTVPPEQLVDAATGSFRQDLAMAVYLKTIFPGWLFPFVSVALLAAGMSTLDGILVALSTISANDLVLNLIKRFGKTQLSEEKRMALAYKLSHAILIAIAAAAFLICLNPPKLLGIFGQVGVYGLAVAAVPPLLGGVLIRRITLSRVWSASVMGLIVHFGLYFFGAKLFPNVNLAFANPSVTASIALIVSVIPSIGGAWLQEWLAEKQTATERV
jgi:SSS family solute:Na+ symporter/sodium/pantothenate symporter